MRCAGEEEVKIICDSNAIAGLKSALSFGLSRVLTWKSVTAKPFIIATTHIDKNVSVHLVIGQHRTKAEQTYWHI